MPLWHAFVVFCIVLCGSVGRTIPFIIKVSLKDPSNFRFPAFFTNNLATRFYDKIYPYSIIRHFCKIAQWYSVFLQGIKIVIIIQFSPYESIFAFKRITRSYSKTIIKPIFKPWNYISD